MFRPKTEQSSDPNMRLALHFAESLGERPAYPASLRGMSIDRRAEMLDRMDGPLIEFWPTDENKLFQLFAQIAKKLGKVAEVTKEYLPDVCDPLIRINIGLRLWAGCLDAAKTIALETRSGPNSAQSRSAGASYIDQVASTDPIYETGVEAAVAFKKRRGDSFSFDGVSLGTRVYKLKE